MQITKGTKIIGGVVLLALLGGGGAHLWWTTQQPSPLPPVAMPKNPSARQSAPTKPKSAAEKPENKSTPAVVDIPVAGNLGRVTQLKAQLDELKLETQIEELQARKKQLTAPPSSAPMLAAKLPDLPLQALTPPKAATSVPATLPSPRSGKTAVVSVQGVEDDVTAVLRTRAGLVTVRRGARFGGGTVSHISRQGVTIRTGNTTTTLRFE